MYSSIHLYALSGPSPAIGRLWRGMPPAVYASVILSLLGAVEGLESVWELASSLPVNPALDCKKDNSPPCRCTRDAEAFAFFPRARREELPVIVEGGSDRRRPHGREFAVLKYDPHPRGTRRCARFAIELSGGMAGVEALNTTFQRIMVASGGSVDVFVHAYAIREPNDELAGLLSSFGDHLRGVHFERWGVQIADHIAALANTPVVGINGSTSPPPMDWLAEHLSRRFSMKECGAAHMSPEHRCKKSWSQVLLHTLSMWRKIHLASNMRQRAERHADCTYDYVVRSRPDVTPKRPLDLRRFPRTADATTVHALCAGMGRRYCKARAKEWPETACWADDQFAIGQYSAMTAYARLFPDFGRFIWWYPLHRADAWRHVSERILGTHLDWRMRGSRLHARQPFRWHVSQPDGKVDFGWDLHRKVCYRCISEARAGR